MKLESKIYKYSPENIKRMPLLELVSRRILPNHSTPNTQELSSKGNVLDNQCHHITPFFSSQFNFNVRQFSLNIILFAETEKGHQPIRSQRTDQNVKNTLGWDFFMSFY